MVTSIYLWFSMSHFAISSRLLKRIYLSAMGSVYRSASVLVITREGTMIAMPLYEQEKTSSGL